MNKRKVTMRDIADQCGISVATVSYVLNHLSNVRVSHTTRLKVVETATKLGYEAKKVRASKRTQSGLIGVVITLKEHNTFGKTTGLYNLAAEISNQLQAIGYETILIVTKNIDNDLKLIKSHNPDAILMLDVDNKTYKNITKDYYVPILFIDCTVSDAIFCEIRPDYNLLFSQARELLSSDDLFLLTEDFYCQDLLTEYSQYVLKKDIFINTVDSNLSDFLSSHKGKKGVVIGDILGAQAQQLFPHEDLVICASLGNPNMFLPGSHILNISNKTKASVTQSVLKEMLTFDYLAGPSNVVLLETERI